MGSSTPPAKPSIGFACGWGRDRDHVWSGTPARLFAALADRAELIDIDVTVPPVVGKSLRLAYARRRNGHWRSMWQHGRPATRLVEQRLRTKVGQAQPDSVLEIGDLGIVARPYYVLQDLSYDLLLDHFGDRGVPHFGNLSRGQIVRLRERQLEVYLHAAGLLPMSRWLAGRSIAAGVDPAKVHVINPGVNAPLDATTPIPTRRQDGVRRLLYIGRDFETKGGDQLIAAFALLRGAFGSDITLTIAGPKRWPLAGEVPAGVNYVGAVPVAAVQALYDSHDLFVMPSRFEGFGIAFVEALVRGLPCVGRRACAMPEIIDPDSGGRLVETEAPDELAAVIVAALDDEELYRRCAEAAPQRRQHYTWARAADEVVAALGSAS
jgi:glycosyltransferase involved in cell wall biosynthesis